MTATLFKKSDCILGEGPYWHKENQSLFWVDIEGKTLYEFKWQSQKTTKWKFPQRISMIAEGRRGFILLGMQDGLYQFHTESHILKLITNLENEINTNRTNDGKCDRQGRLWIGTMDIECRKQAGALYCIYPDGRVNQKMKGLTVSNGIAWSLDDTVFYHIDSADYCVKAYSFNADRGEIKFHSTVIHIPENMGMPDGMTIDDQGNLWIALWGGYCVSCWDPVSGALVRKIDIPAPYITSCTFGGPLMDHLFITTERTGMTEKELKDYPDSGSVFVAIPGSKGFPAPKFGS